MRLSLKTPLSPDECLAKLPAALERAELPDSLKPDFVVSLFTMGDKPPMRVRTEGARIEIVPRYAWPPFCKPLFSGSVSSVEGGSVVVGRVRPTWPLIALAVVWFVPVAGLWLLVTLTHIVCAIAESPSPYPMDLFWHMSIMLGIGFSIALGYYLSLRREMKALWQLIEDTIEDMRSGYMAV